MEIFNFKMGCCESHRDHRLVPVTGVKLGSPLADFKIAIYKNEVLYALQVAEARHGQPVTYLQIFTVYKQLDHYRVPLLFPAFIPFALFDLYMDDRVLADREILYWTLNHERQSTPERPTEFMLYSDRIRTAFPSYILDATNKVIPGPSTPTLNFDYVKELLLSKDLSRNSELDWIKTERDRFLDGKVDMRAHGVAFCSYPRSGNTMLRVFLESITGITTGSNDVLHGGGLSLQTTGLKGESHTSDDRTVWIVKTHPIKAIIPWPKFTGTKAIYLIRNPIDMIVSEFTLYTAASHSHVVNEEIKGSAGFQKWISVAVPRVNVMQRNVQSFAQSVPTLYLTYEMLILQPEQTLTDLFKFFFDVTSIEGTVLEKRIQDVCAQGHAKQAIYGLKTTN